MAPVKPKEQMINSFCSTFIMERASNPKLSVESFAKRFGETMTPDKLRHWLDNYTTDGRNEYISKPRGRPTRLSMEHIGNLVRLIGRDAALKKLKAQTSESTGLRYMKRVRNSIRYH
jgi:transposase